jgi:uncharacterized protein (DUF1499 family)
VKRKMMWAVLLIPLLIVVALAALSATAKRPDTLGMRDARLAPCPDSPNCVSTQADREHQRLEPLRFAGDPAEVLARLRDVISAMPRTRIITADGDYLHAEFTSALFRFVDDVEFFVDREQKVIHFRSASRVGRSDLGVNRRRMQAIAASFVAHDGLPKTDR